MKERTIDILTAVFLIAFSLVMRSQLEGIPREGVLFPLCVLYLIDRSTGFIRSVGAPCGCCRRKTSW